jgi:hypothetical protein
MILEYNTNLIWQSDWAGDEVGHDDIDIVGLWMIIDTDIHLYIDMETNEILSGWHLESDDDDELDITEYTIGHQE